MLKNLVKKIKGLFTKNVDSKSIVVDMTNDTSPKIKLGKDVTPNDVAVFIVRTAVNSEASQYVSELTKHGHKNVATTLGQLTQAKMDVLMSSFLDIMTAPSDSEVDDDSPIINPMDFGFKQ